MISAADAAAGLGAARERDAHAAARPGRRRRRRGRASRTRLVSSRALGLNRIGRLLRSGRRSRAGALD